MEPHDNFQMCHGLVISVVYGTEIGRLCRDLHNSSPLGSPWVAAVKESCREWWRMSSFWVTKGHAVWLPLRSPLQLCNITRAPSVKRMCHVWNICGFYLHLKKSGAGIWDVIAVDNIMNKKGNGCSSNSCDLYLGGCLVWISAGTCGYRDWGSSWFFTVPPGKCWLELESLIRWRHQGLNTSFTNHQPSDAI
jgi:hypothetical protein